MCRVADPSLAKQINKNQLLENNPSKIWCTYIKLFRSSFIPQTVELLILRSCRQFPPFSVSSVLFWVGFRFCSMVIERELKEFYWSLISNCRLFFHRCSLTPVIRIKIVLKTIVSKCNVCLSFNSYMLKWLYSLLCHSYVHVHCNNHVSNKFLFTDNKFNSM